MVLAVAKALERGATSVICASTGNTAASPQPTQLPRVSSVAWCFRLATSRPESWLRPSPTAR